MGNSFSVPGSIFWISLRLPYCHAATVVGRSSQKGPRKGAEVRADCVRPLFQHRAVRRIRHRESSLPALGGAPFPASGALASSIGRCADPDIGSPLFRHRAARRSRHRESSLPTSGVPRFQHRESFAFGMETPLSILDDTPPPIADSRKTRAAPGRIPRQARPPSHRNDG